jgi:peptidyl-prolyl cis-trans isomerase SurA
MQQKIVENVTVTPAEVRAHFRSLKKEEIPEIPDQYEYTQITIRPKIELDEENKVKSRLRDLKKRIENGSSFAAMAVVYSEDPGASSGGDVPYSGRAELDPTYAAAAFNLKGDKISNVVRSEFGYHIIQLIDKKGEKIKTRHILMKPKVSTEALESASVRLDSLANIIRKNEISFDQAAMMYSFDQNTRNNGGLAINPYTMSSKFDVKQLDPDVSKVITSLRINEISDSFKSIDDKGQTIFKVIKLTNKTDKHFANLQNDYQQLAQVYLATKKEKTLKDWIAKQQSDTYIRIDNTYANCNFDFKNWIK